jgi:hypothetical protein
VKLNLRNPLEVGSYQFYLEGAVLSDGSLVDRPYRGIVEIGSRVLGVRKFSGIP